MTRTMRRYFENVTVWARGAQTLNKKKGTLGSCGLPGRRAGVQGAGRGPGGDIRLGNEASAMVADSRESGAGVAWSQARISAQEGVPWGQSRGPHPGLDVLGPAGVGQGVPGLLEGTARWADVRNHHGAAVPPEGILGGGGCDSLGTPPSRHLLWVPSFSLCLSLSHTYPHSHTHSRVLSPVSSPPLPHPSIPLPVPSPNSNLKISSIPIRIWLSLSFLSYRRTREGSSHGCLGIRGGSSLLHPITSGPHGPLF